MLVRVFGLLPWSQLDSNQRQPVRLGFLVGLAIFVGILLFVFWFAMR
jgi:hypothetical protein